MKLETHNQWPASLFDVALNSSSLEEFGLNLRDWQHEIQRSGVHSKTELSRRISERPEILTGKFTNGDIADAYLAAYAEWLADRAGTERPAWCSEQARTTESPWFAHNARAQLLLTTPASFRQRNIFTQPEPIFTPRAGRPKVSEEVKREKNRLRQKAFRERQKAFNK